MPPVKIPSSLSPKKLARFFGDLELVAELNPAYAARVLAEVEATDRSAGIKSRARAAVKRGKARAERAKSCVNESHRDPEIMVEELDDDGSLEDLL